MNWPRARLPVLQEVFPFPSRLKHIERSGLETPKSLRTSKTGTLTLSQPQDYTRLPSKQSSPLERFSLAWIGHGSQNSQRVHTPFTGFSNAAGTKEVGHRRGQAWVHSNMSLFPSGNFQHWRDKFYRKRRRVSATLRWHRDSSSMSARSGPSHGNSRGAMRMAKSLIRLILNTRQTNRRERGSRGCRSEEKFG